MHTPARSGDGCLSRAVISVQHALLLEALHVPEWTGLAAGEHTTVPRAIDVNGVVQPEDADLQSKRTRWENNEQFVRRFTVA
jgi:hypothetical protein